MKIHCALFVGFENALLELDEISRNGTTFEKKEAGRKFLDRIGTQYPAVTQMGSSFAFETR